MEALQKLECMSRRIPELDKNCGAQPTREERKKKIWRKEKGGAREHWFEIVSVRASLARHARATVGRHLRDAIRLYLRTVDLDSCVVVRANAMTTSRREP